MRCQSITSMVAVVVLNYKSLYQNGPYIAIIGLCWEGLVVWWYKCVVGATEVSGSIPDSCAVLLAYGAAFNSA